MKFKEDGLVKRLQTENNKEGDILAMAFNSCADHLCNSIVMDCRI